MKRRKFLGGLAGASTAAIAGGTAQRVHGVPLYTDPNPPTYHRLVLALSNASVPESTWNDIKNYSTAWRSLSLSADSRELFTRDPQAWLTSFNIPPSTMNENDVEMKLLRAFVSAPQLRDSLGNYHAFFSYLVAEGIFDTAAPQQFRAKVRESIRANRAQIEQLLRDQNLDKLLGQNPLEDYPLYELEELVTEINALAETTTSALQVAIAAVVVVVAAFVLTYAGVGINLTAVLNISLAISVLTYLAVTLCGPVDQYHYATQNPFFQSLLAIDEETKKNLTSASRAAYLCKRPDYAFELICNFVESETRTVLEAANDTGLIQLPKAPDHRERYIVLCGQVARKALTGAMSVA